MIVDYLNYFQDYSFINVSFADESVVVRRIVVVPALIFRLDKDFFESYQLIDGNDFEDVGKLNYYQMDGTSSIKKTYGYFKIDYFIPSYILHDAYSHDSLIIIGFDDHISYKTCPIDHLPSSYSYFVIVHFCFLLRLIFVNLEFNSPLEVSLEIGKAWLRLCLLHILLHLDTFLDVLLLFLF